MTVKTKLIITINIVFSLFLFASLEIESIVFTLFSIGFGMIALLYLHNKEFAKKIDRYF